MKQKLVLFLQSNALLEYLGSWDSSTCWQNTHYCRKSNPSSSLLSHPQPDNLPAPHGQKLSEQLGEHESQGRGVHLPSRTTTGEAIVIPWDTTQKNTTPIGQAKAFPFCKTRSQASILVYFYFYFHHCPSQTNMTFRGAHGFTLQHCPSCEVSSAKCALEISKNKQLRRNCSAGKKQQLCRD